MHICTGKLHMLLLMLMLFLAALQNGCTGLCHFSCGSGLKCSDTTYKCVCDPTCNGTTTVGLNEACGKRQCCGNCSDSPAEALRREHCMHAALLALHV